MPEMFKIRKSVEGQYYFTLHAANNEIIATSEMYESKQGCENGIESVRQFAPTAPVEEDFD